jgi:hypothetical protein
VSETAGRQTNATPAENGAGREASTTLRTWTQTTAEKQALVVQISKHSRHENNGSVSICSLKTQQILVCRKGYTMVSLIKRCYDATTACTNQNRAGMHKNLSLTDNLQVIGK